MYTFIFYNNGRRNIQCDKKHNIYRNKQHTDIIIYVNTHIYVMLIHIYLYMYDEYFVQTLSIYVCIINYSKRKIH